MPLSRLNIGSLCHAASSRSSLLASRFPVGSRNVNPFSVPSAASKNSNSAAASSSLRSAYVNTHEVSAAPGSASFIVLPSAATLVTVLVRLFFSTGN